MLIPICIVRHLRLSQSKIYSASEDKTIRIWNTLTGDCLHVLESPEGVALDMAVSPSYLMTSHLQRTLRAWNASSGDLLYKQDDVPGFFIQHDDLKMMLSWGTRVSGAEPGLEGEPSQNCVQIYDVRSMKQFKSLMIAKTGVSYLFCFQGRFCMALLFDDYDSLYSLEVWDFSVSDEPLAPVRNHRLRQC